jgi:hypothetical protein
MTLFDVTVVLLCCGIGAGVGRLFGQIRVGTGALAGFLIGMVMMLANLHWRIVAWVTDRRGREHGRSASGDTE